MHYQRHIDPEGDDSLARLLWRIPQGSAVLELGPATGYCSRHLRESLGCEVDAVELSADMAEQARPWCRRLVVGDVETLDLDQVFAGCRYDVILCADVLEHLRDPWALAHRLAGLLAPGGRLLLSVPNAAYLGLLVDLLRGRFRYRDEGLLDRTHLRFFTLDSLRELLEQAGWQLWAAEQIPLSLTDSEFRVRLEALAPALRDELLARPDALCYQWVVEARREPAPQPLDLPQASPEDRFQVRVFWRGAGEAFADARNRLVWGALGREQQTVRHALPPGQQALALRLSDRVGFVRLDKVSLLDTAGAALWEWTAGQGALPVAACRQIEAADGAGRLWFVSGTASLLELALPDGAVARAAAIELRLDAPISADFLAAKAYWEDPQGLPAQLSACKARSERLAGLRSVLGDDEAAWPRYARALGVAKKVPGLLALLDRIGGGKPGAAR